MNEINKFLFELAKDEDKTNKLFVSLFHGLIERQESISKENKLRILKVMIPALFGLDSDKEIKKEQLDKMKSFVNV